MKTTALRFFLVVLVAFFGFNTEAFAFKTEVKKGEGWVQIKERTGYSKSWRKLMLHNASVLPDPDNPTLLYTGITIDIPEENVADTNSGKKEMVQAGLPVKQTQAQNFVGRTNLLGQIKKDAGGCAIAYVARLLGTDNEKALQIVVPSLVFVVVAILCFWFAASFPLFPACAFGMLHLAVCFLWTQFVVKLEALGKLCFNAPLETVSAGVENFPNDVSWESLPKQDVSYEILDMKTAAYYLGYRSEAIVYSINPIPLIAKEEQSVIYRGKES